MKLLENTFPWPVWGIIIKYTNCWNLRSVCSRFKKIIDASHRFDFTDLDALCRRGTLEIMKLYVAQHHYEYYYITTSFRDFRIIKFLIGKNYSKDMFTRYLLRSCLTGDVAVIKYFLEEIPLLEKHICSCIENVYANGKPEIINLFADYINDYAEYAVIGVCKSGNIELYRKLKEDFSNASWIFIHSKTFALQSRNTEFIKEVYGLEDLPFPAKAMLFVVNDVKTIKEISITNLRKCLFIACENGAYEAAEYLINEKKAIVEKKHLSYAAGSGNLKLFKFLENFENFDPIECLEYACSNARLDIVNYLLEKKAPVTLTALKNACRREGLKIVKSLIAAGATVEKKIVTKVCTEHLYDISHYFTTLPDTPNCDCDSKCPVGRQKN